ncbi:hypothetical protein [uncultured Chryseobacterium sp.]|uniref:hypothetical protein n=1 Tax=uncultured Chryseobacterium sp. TaxID=259322 RepID=UPI0025F7450B|nr:hypothetical protein [uncultured Chryseobacterium sp.]
MKQLKETHSNKMMKLILIYIALLILGSCNGQTSEQVKHPIEKMKLINKKNDSRINFLAQKYQINGFSVSDNLKGDLYPSYSYFEKNIGAFSVNFIGKNKQEQYYWNINNITGYFSQKENPYKLAENSKEIKKILDSRNEKYYIIASFMDIRYIEGLSKETEEYEVSKNAIEFIYLYENNRWVLIKTVKESEIPENSLKFFEKLILDYHKINEK